MVRAIEFRGPDRVPIVHVVLPAAASQFGQQLENLLVREFPDDVGAWWRSLADGPSELYDEGRHVDAWGCVWENRRAGMLGRVVFHPLADWNNWQTYRFPPLDVPQQAATAQARIWRQSCGHYLFGSGGLFGNIAMWEQMILLRGYENVMLDLATRDRRLYRLRDVLLERALETLQWDVQTDADGIGFGDDWGMQRGLMIGPDLWREFFRPVYRAMFQVVRAAGKHVHFHTDGDTTEILGDLVDIGVSVLNVQHSVMNVEQIGRDFGGRVTFRSDIDCQYILQRGTRREVFDHVRQVFECLGSYDGGLIWHGEIEPDRPLQNVRWMLEAFREIGVYA
jgi:hypothetical protein